MASFKEPPDEDILARRLQTHEARQRFQDYVIAFEWFRTLEERSRLGDPDVVVEMSTAAVRLELAHKAWREFVIGGVRAAPTWYRPGGD